MARTATIVRETSESKVELSLNLDGTGKTDIDTSVPFYNHMMTALGKHSLIDLKIKATGDTDIDRAPHRRRHRHRIRRGSEAGLGDKRGIRRFADAPCRSTRHSPKPSSTFPAARTACAPASRKASNTA